MTVNYWAPNPTARPAMPSEARNGMTEDVISGEKIVVEAQLGIGEIVDLGVVSGGGSPMSRESGGGETGMISRTQDVAAQIWCRP